MSVSKRRYILGVDGAGDIRYTHPRTSQSIQYIARKEQLSLRDAETLDLCLGVLSDCSACNKYVVPLRQILMYGDKRFGLDSIVEEVGNCADA